MKSKNRDRVEFYFNVSWRKCIKAKYHVHAWTAKSFVFYSTEKSEDTLMHVYSRKFLNIKVNGLESLKELVARHQDCRQRKTKPQDLWKHRWHNFNTKAIKICRNMKWLFEWKANIAEWTKNLHVHNDNPQVIKASHINAKH